MLSCQLLALAFMAALTSAVPTSSPNNQLQARASVPVYSTCSKGNTFALTFDDGPYSYGKDVVTNLNNNNAKGTFFVNGFNYGCIYDQGSVDQIKSRYAQGHMLGNHGWGHIHSNQANRDQLHNQLWLVEKAFIQILGVKPLYFRAPYGEYNDLLLQVLSERGYKGLILWDQDSGDTFSPQPSASSIINSYSKFPAKSLTLNHETQSRTVYEVMPTVIPALKRRGLSLVTVAECIGASTNKADWYAYVQAPSNRDNTWTCEGTPGPGVIG